MFTLIYKHSGILRMVSFPAKSRGAAYRKAHEFCNVNRVYFVTLKGL